MARTIYNKNSKLNLEFLLPDIQNTIYLPYADEGVQAGFPSPAQDFIEDTIDLNKELIKHPHDTIIVRVNDYSLSKMGIDNGNFLILDTKLTPKSGDIIICSFDGQVEIKIFRKEKEAIHLYSDFSDSSPMILSKEMNYKLEGVVTYQIKNFIKRRSLDFPFYTENGVQTSLELGDIKKLLNLNNELIKHPAYTFLVKVKGHSLKDIGIEDGNTLLIDKSLIAKVQDVVICTINNEFTVKILKEASDGIYLMPANPEFQPIKLTKENDSAIWGITTYSIKNLRLKRRA